MSGPRPPSAPYPGGETIHDDPALLDFAAGSDAGSPQNAAGTPAPPDNLLDAPVKPLAAAPPTAIASPAPEPGRRLSVAAGAPGPPTAAAPPPTATEAPSGETTNSSAPAQNPTATVSGNGTQQQQQQQQAPQVQKAPVEKKETAEDMLKLPNFDEVNDPVQCMDAFLRSEHFYVERALRVIVEGFEERLRHHITVGDQVLTPEEISSVFLDIARIYDFHQRMLDDLQTTRMAGPDVLYQNLGSKMSTFIPFFKMYVHYIETIKKARKSLLTLIEKKSTFRKWLQLNELCAGHSLSTLLDCPVARLPQYLIFLGSIHKLSDPTTQAAQELLQAIIAIQQVADNISSTLQNIKYRNLVLRVQERHFKGNLDVVSPHRWVVKMGELTVINPKSMFGKRFRTYLFVLFNDFLLYGSKRTKIQNGRPRAAIRLDGMLLKPRPNGPDYQNAFQIGSLLDGTVLELHASSQKELTEWLRVLHEAVEQNDESTRSLQSTKIISCKDFENQVFKKKPRSKIEMVDRPRPTSEANARALKDFLSPESRRPRRRSTAVSTTLAASSSASASSNGAGALGNSGWERLVDSHGTPYYENRKLGLTQWDQPPGWVDPEGWIDPPMETSALTPPSRSPPRTDSSRSRPSRPARPSRPPRRGSVAVGGSSTTSEVPTTKPPPPSMPRPPSASKLDALSEQRSDVDDDGASQEEEEEGQGQEEASKEAGEEATTPGGASAEGIPPSARPSGPPPRRDPPPPARTLPPPRPPLPEPEESTSLPLPLSPPPADASLSPPSASPPATAAAAAAGPMPLSPPKTDMPSRGGLLADIRQGANLKSTETSSSSPGAGGLKLGGGGGLLADIRQGAALKPVDKHPPPPAAGSSDGASHGDLLSQIKGGARLRKTEPASRETEKPQEGLAGAVSSLQDALKTSLHRYRQFVQNDEDDSDDDDWD